MPIQNPLLKNPPVIKKLTKTKSFIISAIALSLIACSDDSVNHYSPGSFDHAQKQLQQALDHKPNTNKAKGIILFVGDGMSIATVTASRIYAGQQLGQPGEEYQLNFESFPYTGLAKTYNTNQQTPDSAGTMTAMITGSKTKAGLISVNTLATRADPASCNGFELETLLETAEDNNWATGIVTTTTVTHATPAAAYAHSPERNWESDGALPESTEETADLGCKDIAHQLIDFNYGDGIEVVLGGGRSHFLPKEISEVTDASEAAQVETFAAGKRDDGRNLIEEWRSKKSKRVYVSNSDELAAVNIKKTKQLFGLFSQSHLEFEADRITNADGQPSLTAMVETAISMLQKNKRFLLIVESGRIDHAHHAGNAYRALEEAVEFDNAVAKAMELVDSEKTLMIVTADHSHTMTLAGYPTRGNPILGFVKGNDSAGNPEQKVTLAKDNNPYTTLSYANGPGYFNQPMDKSNPYARYLGPAKSGRHTTLSDDPESPHYHQEANIPMQAETHAGDDVAVFAQGPWAHLLTGVIEQNYIYHVMKHAGDL